MKNRKGEDVKKTEKWKLQQLVSWWYGVIGTDQFEGFYAHFDFCGVVIFHFSF